MLVSVGVKEFVGIYIWNLSCWGFVCMIVMVLLISYYKNEFMGLE